jgi:hypothetical protein
MQSEKGGQIHHPCEHRPSSSEQNTNKLLEQARARTRKELLKGMAKGSTYPAVNVLLLYGLHVPVSPKYCC